jgi:hypothetical protein
MKKRNQRPYSEKTITFQMKNGKFITIPSVDTKGDTFSQKFLEDYVDTIGPIDPLTKEVLPVFDTMTEAEQYAVERSQEKDYGLLSKNKQQSRMDLRKQRVANEFDIMERVATEDADMDLQINQQPLTGEENATR